MSLPSGVFKSQNTTVQEIKNDNSVSNITTNDTIGFGNWLLSMILYAIPIVNIIYVLVTIFTTKNTSKKNWAIAALIVLVISYIISFAFLYFLKTISLATLFQLYSSYVR
jgi:high-affinity Fe2+/Pb2+ permease